MSNVFDQMRLAIQQAKLTQRAVEDQAMHMAEMLVGNLRHCHGSDLAKLKRELRDFNIQTHRWSSK